MHISNHSECHLDVVGQSGHRIFGDADPATALSEAAFHLVPKNLCTTI